MTDSVQRQNELAAANGARAYPTTTAHLTTKEREARALQAELDRLTARLEAVDAKANKVDRAHAYPDED